VKPKIGFKVVDVVNGKLVSSSETGVKRKTYYINKYVKRNKKYGPLCLFKTLSAARQYYKNINNLGAGLRFRIYKAEYKGSKDTVFIYTSGRKITLEVLVNINSTGSLRNIPIGDFLVAESVKLLKEYPK